MSIIMTILGLIAFVKFAKLIMENDCLIFHTLIQTSFAYLFVSKREEMQIKIDFLTKLCHLTITIHL